MAIETEVAKLIGKLRFEADNRPLLIFTKNLEKVKKQFEELQTLTNKKLVVKLGINQAALKAELKKVTDQNLSFNNINISGAALGGIRGKIQKVIGGSAFNLKLGFNAGRLKSTLRRELNGLMASIGPINIPSPKILLRVDQKHLRSEIQTVLAQISREAKIRLDLRGDFSRGRPARREGRGGGGGEGYGGGRREGNFASKWGGAAVGGLGAAFGIDNINKINQEVTAATNSLEAVSGNEDNFKSNKAYLEKITKEMGLTFRDMAPQYSSIYQAAAPSIGIQGTQDMFRGIMQYGTTHGLGKEAMKGSMVAISQMFGKDKIQAEEARQQFAERMPNGMAMLADAAKRAGQTKNGTVAEFSDLMQSGKADPKKILPELGRLMKEASERNNAYAKSLDTTRVAQGRMVNQFETSVVVFAKAGFDNSLGKFFNDVAKALEKAEPLVKALGVAFDYLMLPMRALVTLLGDLGKHFDELSNWLGVSSGFLTTFTGLGVLALTPFGRLAEVIGLVALAVEDFVTYLEGGDSVFGDWMKSLSPDKAENIKAMGTALMGVVESLKTLGELSFKGWSDIFGYFEGGSAIDTVIKNITAVADAFNKMTSAISKIANGDFSSVGDDAKALVENTVGKQIQTVTAIPRGIGDYASKTADSVLRERSPTYKNYRDRDEIEARKKSYENTAPSPLMPKEQAGPPANLAGAVTPVPGTVPVTVNGNIVLQFPNAKGDPTEIEKAVNDAMGKVFQTINSNQTQGEQ